MDDLVSRCLGGRRARRMRFYFLPEPRNGGGERRGEDRKTGNTRIMRIQVAHTQPRTYARLLLPFVLYRLLTQFLAFLRPALQCLYFVSYARFLRLRLDFFSRRLSSSSSIAAAAASYSSPSASSRGYVQARCIPEPREWKDLVKASRSLAYA